MEKFNVDYINSNLQRILDTVLTYQSGLGYEVKAQGVLFKNMKAPKFIVSDDGVNKVYNPQYIHGTLAFPFENMYVNAGFTIDTNRLPRIDTQEFGVRKGKLTVDYSVFDFMTYGSPKKSSDILYDGTKVGEYILDNESKTIRLWFDFEGAGLEEVVFDSTNNGAGEYVYLDIHYPFTTGYNQNIPFAGNTLPRLRKVEFKNN
jgi:hypothetical protein